MNIRDFTMEELFEKRLYFLIPFYFVNYEKEMPVFERDHDSRRAFLAILSNVLMRLDAIRIQCRLSDIGYTYVTEFIRRLIEYQARDYMTVREEADEVMGGKVINFEARSMYEKGKTDEKKNSDQRTIRVYQNCIARGMSEADAIAISEISDELLRKIKK